MVEFVLVIVDFLGFFDFLLFEDFLFKFSVREGESGFIVGFIKVCCCNGFFVVFLSLIENYGVFLIMIF